MGLLDLFFKVNNHQNSGTGKNSADDEPMNGETDLNGWQAEPTNQEKVKKAKEEEEKINPEKYRVVSLGDVNPILLPDSDYDGNIVVNKFGDWSAMFKVDFPEVYSLDGYDYELLVNNFSRAINMFAPGFVIHFVWFAAPIEVKVKANMESRMDRWFTSHLGIRKAVKADCYVTFTKVGNPNRKATDYNGPLSIINFDPVFEKSHYDKNAVREMYSEVEKFISTVSNALGEDFKRIKFTELNSFQAWNVITNRYLNGSWEGESRESPEVISRESYITIGDKNLFTSIMNHNGYPTELATALPDPENSQVRIGEVNVSTVHQLVYGLDFPHVVHNVIYTIDQKKTRNGLESRLRMMRSLSPGSIWNQSKLKGLEEHLHLISEHPEYKMVEHVFAVQILCGNALESEQSDRRNRLKNLVSALGLGVNKCNFSTMNYFLALTPGVASIIPEGARALGLSEYAACMMCYEDLQRSAIKGVPFLERRFRTPVLVDIWNYPGIENRNMLTIGSSGAGKSFLLGHIVSYFLHLLIDVVIVDIGFSYKKLLQLENDEWNRSVLNGLQDWIKKNALLIESTPANPLEYNPFLVAVKDENGVWKIPDDEEVDPASFIVSLLFMVWKGGEGRMTPEVNAVLYRTVAEYYKYFNEKAREEREGDSEGKNKAYCYPSLTGYYDYMIANFKRLFPRATKEHFDLVSFEMVLYEYAYGSRKKILNCERNPEIFNARFIIFELEHIKGDPFLFGITSMLIMQVVLDKMIHSKKGGTKKGKYVYLLMDEVWKILGSSMEPFVKYMYKTARKHDGAINIAAQEADDIIKSGIGEAINNNSEIKLLTAQNGDKRDQLKNYFSLTEAQTNLLYSLRKHPGGARDVFMKFGSKACAFTFEVSPEQALVLSSKAGDKQEVNEVYAANGNNMEQAVCQVLENRGAKNYIDEEFK